MSASAAAPSDVLHISTRFDDSVHEYQFARSHPQLFAQLQQLTAAKYPLTPLFVHWRDDDGDMVRVTNEAELREAVRVCGSRLNLILSSDLPSSSTTSASPAPQHQSIASPTLLTQTPSPSPSLASSTSPAPAWAAAGGGPDPGGPIGDIDDYLSSDEEELFVQARSQVRSQLSQRSSPDVGVQAEAEPLVEADSPRYDVVALDSDEDEDDVKAEPGAADLPDAAGSDTAVPVADTQLVAEEQVFLSAAKPAAEPFIVSATTASDKLAEAKEPQFVEEQEDLVSAVSSLLSSSPQPEQPHVNSIPQTEASPDFQTEHKDDTANPIEAINARLRSFYQLDEQRQAVLNNLSSTTASYPTASPAPAPSSLPVAIASLFSSFFAEPAVIATIRDNAALLTPLMGSSFPLFLHQLCLLNPVLSSHPLTRFTFSLSSLHPFTVCVHCSASPVIGRLLYCRSCDVTLCGTCQQLSQHPTDHQLAELAVRQYRGESDIASTPVASVAAPANANGSVSGVRLDDSGRVLEERKASDFAELSDRMRASGQRAWKQSGASLRKVDEMLTQFAADIKHMIESMLDGVFSDRSKHSQQPQQQAAEEQKQQPMVSPHLRQQQATGCNVRRAPCLPASRPNPAAFVDGRQAGVALAQPARQSMAVAEQRLQQQQASREFVYRAQLDLMADMGLIKSVVDEQTCRELLTASKGNVDQAVQWLMDKINV